MTSRARFAAATAALLLICSASPGRAQSRALVNLGASPEPVPDSLSVIDPLFATDHYEVTILGGYARQHEAYGLASVSQGLLRASTRVVSNGTGFAQTTSAVVQVDETLTFSAPAGTAPAPITFHMRVDGTYSLDNLLGNSQASQGTSATRLKIDNVTAGADYAESEFISSVRREGGVGGVNVEWTHYPTGDVQVLTDALNGIDVILSPTVLVRPGDVFDLTAYLRTTSSAIVNATAATDFTHTATVSIDLPAGWSYTSASGQFLTAAVPEPAALAVLPLLALLARRRRPPLA